MPVSNDFSHIVSINIFLINFRMFYIIVSIFVIRVLGGTSGSSKIKYPRFFNIHSMKTRIIIGFCCCLFVLWSCNPPNNQKEDISVKGKRITEVPGEIPNPLDLDYQYHSNTTMEDGSIWQFFLEKGKPANKDSYYVWGKSIPTDASLNNVVMYIYPMDLSVVNVNHIYSWLENNVDKEAILKVESPENYQGRVKLLDIYNNCNNKKTKIIVSYKSKNKGKTVFIAFDYNNKEIGLSYLLTPGPTKDNNKRPIATEKNTETELIKVILDPSLLEYQSHDSIIEDEDGVLYNTYIEKNVTDIYANNVWLKMIPFDTSQTNFLEAYEISISLNENNNRKIYEWAINILGENTRCKVIEAPTKFTGELRLSAFYNYCIENEANITVSYISKEKGNLIYIVYDYKYQVITITYLIFKKSFYS